MASEVKEQDYEIAHVVFIDIVGYSKLSIDQQQAAIDQLTQLVRATEQFQKADRAGRLVKIATGDGMALVFYTSPDAPVRCAMEVGRRLKGNDQLQLRMGVHSGPVSDVTDVTGRTNLAGAGLNFAQRVMNCGDAGHILLSRHVAEDLSDFEEWKPLLHDLGPCEVKHGVEVSVVNLHGNGIGNPTIPETFRIKQQKEKKRRTKQAIVYSLILVGAIAAAGLWWWWRSQHAGTAPVGKSVAVMPFENLSDDKANAYFVAGMQDEILTALAKVRDLKVISRTSTAKYQSRPDNLKTIAQELGVAAILEGSVQRLGDAVHINVQLINARDDAHVWAESYDRELKNLFAVQREVAETVAAKLKAQLSPQDTKELSRVPTTNPTAYDRYLKARYVVTEWNSGRQGSLKPAIDFYKEAVALDPNFALAYVKLADAEGRYYVLENRSPQIWADTTAHITRARELEPDLIEVHLFQANAYWYVDHDPARALAELEPLLARAPNDPRISYTISVVKGQMDDWQGQIAALQRAIELDPRNTTYLAELAILYSKLWRYRESLETFARAKSIEAEDWLTRANTGFILILSDRLTEAQTELQQLPDTKLPNLTLALKYASLEQIETLSRNYDGALAYSAKIPDMPNRMPTIYFSVGNIQKNTDLGFLYLYKGDKTSAEKAFTAVRNEMQNFAGSGGNVGQKLTDDPDYCRSEAYILAGMGQRAEAIESARKAVSLSKHNNYLISLAQISAYLGDADQAFETLQKVIDKPTGGDGISAALLRRDPIWDAIRKDRRFEKATASLAAKEVK